MNSNFTGKSYRNEKTAEQIDNNFKHRVPKEDQTERFEALQGIAKIFARAINSNCPDSREKALALTSLEDSVLWATEAIARNE